MPTKAKLDTGQLLTVSNWRQSAEEIMTNHGDTEYISANEHFIPVLENMANGASSFEELKAQLLALVRERKKFVEFANKNQP